MVRLRRFAAVVAVLWLFGAVALLRSTLGQHCHAAPGRPLPTGVWRGPRVAVRGAAGALSWAMLHARPDQNLCLHSPADTL